MRYGESRGSMKKPLMNVMYLRKFLNNTSLGVTEWRQIPMLTVIYSHVKHNERQDASDNLLLHQSYLFLVLF